MNPTPQQGPYPSLPPTQPYPPYPVQPGMLPPQPTPLSANSRKPRPRGLIITLIICIILFLSALIFGIWAFAERQDYKFNSDQKAAKAVAIAVQKESTRKDNEFVEKEKNPLKSYQGSGTYGSVLIQYPKTWGAYIIETKGTPTPIDGYFHPNFVPGQQSGTAFALRLQVTGRSYEQEMKQFEASVKAGKVTITPYVPKNVPGITGARIHGEINQGQVGTMVVLPLRDKTLKISTESQQFIGDFDNIILANLKFSP